MKRLSPSRPRKEPKLTHGLIALLALAATATAPLAAQAAARRHGRVGPRGLRVLLPRTSSVIDGRTLCCRAETLANAT
jgi:hypothetical protein